MSDPSPQVYQRPFIPSTVIKTLQVVLFAALAVFVFVYLRQQWQTLQTEDLRVNWGVFLIAQTGMCVGLGMLPYGSWLSLAYLGDKRSMVEVWRTFYVSGIAKYLPGSVWALPGRVFLYQRAGITPITGVAALVWEMSILVVSAFAVSMLSLGLAAHYIPLEVLVGLLAAAALSALGLVVVLRWGFGWQQVKRLIPERVRRGILDPEIRLTFPQAITIFLVHVAAWVVLGLAFTGMAYAVSPTFEWVRSIEMIGVFAGSWAVGFLAIFAPGGIGVRDVLIGLALAVFLSAPAPFVITVLSRIGWTAAELVGTLVSSYLYARRRKVAEV